MALLAFNQVSRIFPADGPGRPERVVLDGVDLTIEEQEVVALVGRSGAGKTTLLYLAAGLCRPSAGQVFFAGHDLSALGAGPLSRLRRQVGLVFQNNLSLSALPVWENAAFPLLLEGLAPAKARPRAEEMLERVGLGSLADQSTTVLSGGQRRRLGLARAMIGRPRLLLADEPTADLDEETSAQIEGLMFDWLAGEGRAGLIVTHAASVREAATRTLRLESGRIEPLTNLEKER